MKRDARKNKYIEYDYEAAYTEQIEKLEQDQIERLIRKGYVIYATKEIRSGSQLEVEIYPEFTREQKKEIPQAALEKRRARQKNLNERNSRKACERLINTNFGDGDIWATLTYDKDNVPESMEEATKDIQNYIKRLNYARRKQGLDNVAFVRVVENNEGSGRWHHHLILRGDMSMDLVEDTWKKASRNTVRRIKSDDDGITGMAIYITKEKKAAGQKKWASSKGLKKPETTKNHYKFKNKNVKGMVRDRDSIKPELLKWYGDKYEYSHAEVRYNDVNGRFYINARLHRQPERTGKWKTGRKNRAGGRGGGSRTARQRKREEDGSAGGSSGRRSRSR